MIYFKKLFKFPGPKDLGMSDSNYAMPSRYFRNNNTEVYWEDYYEHLQKTYPLKFFIASTAPEFFIDLWRDVSRPFKKFHYWFVSHTIPSRKYHLLDLRQPKTEADPYAYRYGWIDTDHQMEYAIKNLIVKFVEEEMPGSYFIPSEEEVAKDDGINLNYSGYKRQLDNHKEYMEIYKYFTVEQLQLEKNYDDLLSAWSNSKDFSLADYRGNPATAELWKRLGEAEKIRDDKLDEMLHRAINIRKCLWT